MSLARSRRPVFGIALKDAGLAALIAAGLFLPMVGLRTDVGPTGALFLRTRWTDVLLLMTIVFAGRFLMRLWQEWRVGRPGLGVSKRLAGPLSRSGRFVAPVILLFAVLLPVIPGIGRYELDLGILVLTYVMLGWGLNIVVGLAGLLDLGYVAFYAVGAYSYALLAQNFGLSFWVCLPLAGILSAFAGVLLGFPVLRLRGDYLAIVTLGFGEIIRLILLNWASLTGGTERHLRHPPPQFFWPDLHRWRRAGFLRRFLRAGAEPDTPRCLPVLSHPRPGAADQLGHAAPAPPAARPRLGSDAGG
jgi:branched-chain amino acid transport system permease protein